MCITAYFDDAVAMILKELKELIENGNYLVEWGKPRKTSGRISYVAS